jgi:hypothetical protein
MTLDMGAILYIKSMLAIDQGNYPERLKHLFIINCPWYFKMLYSVFTAFIDKKTQEKFLILGTDYMETLTKYIDVGTVPQEMGGEAKDVIWVGPFADHTGISDEQVTVHVYNKYSTPQQSELLNPDELDALKKACDICTEMGMCETFHIIPPGSPAAAAVVSPRGSSKATGRSSNLPSNASEMLGAVDMPPSARFSDADLADASLDKPLARGDCEAKAAASAVSDSVPTNPTITLLNMVYAVIAVCIGAGLLWKQCSLNSCSFILLFYWFVYAALHLALV